MEDRVERLRKMFQPKANLHQVGKGRKTIRLCRPIKSEKVIDKPKRKYQRRVVSTKHFTPEEIQKTEEQKKLEAELYYWFGVYLEKYKAKRA